MKVIRHTPSFSTPKRFIYNSLFCLIISFFILYLTIRFILIFTDHTKFTSVHWIFITISSFVITTFIYLREVYITRKDFNNDIKKEIIDAGKTDLMCLLSELDFNSSVENDSMFVNILEKVQKSVELILEENQIQKGIISVNLMFYKEEPSSLYIKYYAEKFDGHGELDFSLPVDFDKPQDGGPYAFVYKKNIYIPDTTESKFNVYINESSGNQKVASFISLPIWDDNKKAILILNIDSDLKNQFMSEEFLKVQLYPRLKYFIYCLRLLYKIIPNHSIIN